jgi:hypothetical protein
MCPLQILYLIGFSVSIGQVNWVRYKLGFPIVLVFINSSLEEYSNVLKSSSICKEQDKF